MDDIFLRFVTFMEAGGNVLWAIAAVTFLMWALLFERLLYFQTDHKRMVREAAERWEGRPERRSWSAHQIREAIISDASDRIVGTMPLIQTCVALCPLLGLLGTVTGMIAVFDAMASQGGNARSMAAGVSMATIPTMAGMVAALSGTFGSTILRRKIDYEIELFQSHLTMDH